MFLFLPFVQSDSYHLHFFYLTFLYQPMYTGQPKPDMCSHFGRAFFLFNQDLMQTSNRSRSQLSTKITEIAVLLDAIWARFRQLTLAIQQTISIKISAVYLSPKPDQRLRSCDHFVTPRKKSDQSPKAFVCFTFHWMNPIYAYGYFTNINMYIYESGQHDISH